MNTYHQERNAKDHRTRGDLSVAAFGDLHLGLKEEFNTRILANLEADLLLIAGDFTEFGTEEQWASGCDLLRSIKIPTFLIFGNHDHFSRLEDKAQTLIKDIPNVRLLSGDYSSMKIKGKKVGIVGLEGALGGFSLDLESEFNKEFADAFKQDQVRESVRLELACQQMDIDRPDVRIGLLHYVPFEELVPKEIFGTNYGYGSDAIGNVLAKYQFDLIVYGHVHQGTGDIRISDRGFKTCNVSLPANRGSLSYFAFDFSDVNLGIWKYNT